MITSTMGRMAEAEKLSVPQLQQAIKSGSLPAYIGIPLLQDKMKQMKQAQSAQQAQQPQQPPIADQIMQQAQAMNPGVEQLRSNISPESMAAGGIIAFEDGGEVHHFKKGGKSEDDDQATVDYNRALAASNIPGYAYHALLPAFAYGQDALSAGANYIGDAYNNIRDRNTMVIDPVTKQPISKAALHDQPINQAAKDVAAQYQGAPVAPANLGTMPIGNMATALGANSQSDNPLAALATRGNAPAGAPDTASASTDISASYKGPGVGAPVDRGFNAGIDKIVNNPNLQWTDIKSNNNIAKLKEHEQSAIEYRDKWKELIGKDPNGDKMEAAIADMAKRATREEEKAPWMALMKAGLSTMAGTSPFALANIGKGGQEGLTDYIAAQDRVEKLRDKATDLQFKVGQAKRAEDVAAAGKGWDSAEAQKHRNSALDLAQAQHDNQLQLTNAEGRLHSAQAQTTAGLQGANIKSENTYRMGELAKIDEQIKTAKSNANKAEIQALTQRISEGLNAAVKTHSDAMKDDQLNYPKSAEAKANLALISGYQARLAALTGVNYAQPAAGSTLPPLTDKTASSFFK